MSRQILKKPSAVPKTRIREHSRRSGMHRADACQLMIGGLPFGVVLADTKGRIIYRNPASRRWVPTDIRNVQRWLERTRISNDSLDWKTAVQRILDSELALERILHIPAQSHGESSSAVIRIAPIAVTKRKEIESFVMTIQDVSSSSSLADQDETARRLVTLGKLASRVAHELNNPLDGILRYINLALRVAAGTTEPRLQSYLSQSRTGLLRMTEIIADLLEFSRTSTTETQVAPIHEIIEEVLRQVYPSADAARVVVTVDQQTQDSPAIRGSRLHQVLRNLIQNALDAMPGGGRLSIAHGLVADNVVIRVSDTGVGLPIPPEKVFEPFYTTKPPGKGTGLGLAISRELLAELGGAIQAEAGQPSGAVFTIRLPVSSLEPVPSATSRHVPFPEFHVEA